MILADPTDVRGAYMSGDQGLVNIFLHNHKKLIGCLLWKKSIIASAHTGGKQIRPKDCPTATACTEWCHFPLFAHFVNHLCFTTIWVHYYCCANCPGDCLTQNNELYVHFTASPARLNATTAPSVWVLPKGPPPSAKDTSPTRGKKYKRFLILDISTPPFDCYGPLVGRAWGK